MTIIYMLHTVVSVIVSVMGTVMYVLYLGPGWRPPAKYPTNQQRIGTRSRGPTRLPLSVAPVPPTSTPRCRLAPTRRGLLRRERCQPPPPVGPPLPASSLPTLQPANLIARIVRPVVRRPMMLLQPRDASCSRRCPIPRRVVSAWWPPWPPRPRSAGWRR